MTNEEAINYNKNLREYMRITDEKSEYKFLQENYEALEMAIKALEQQPKMGHWEWVQYDSNPNIGNWHCSECNRIVHGAIKYAYMYCPNCGARMEVEEDAE